MEKKNIHIHFYKESLQKAENEIRLMNETGKALKDIIGKAYETHRKRLWNYFGFNVSKDKHGALFGVDWSISYKGKLIAFEEVKGHYLDSCFFERVLSGFCKTIYAYQQKGKPVPLLIIHSFTKYKNFNQKLKEDLDTRKKSIVDEIKKKLVYSTLLEVDRLPKKRWFSKNLYDCYSMNTTDELIFKDIKFIMSLVPVE